jgi:protein-S-isoprenylcysteine O-methyltransferase Ste14
VHQTSEAQVQQELAQSPEAQHLLRRLAIRRATIVLGLVAVLGLFLLWLPVPSRRLLTRNLVANQLLIALLLLFGLVAISLLWSKGQRLDVWWFNVLNLRGYHAIWMDRTMWVATQIGNV